MYCPTPSKPAKTFNGCGAKSWPEAARHPCARPRSWTAYRTDKSRRCSERSATPSMGSSRARPRRSRGGAGMGRSEEHTSELQSHSDLVCRLLLEKKKNHEQSDWNI